MLWPHALVNTHLCVRGSSGRNDSRFRPGEVRTPKMDLGLWLNDDVQCDCDCKSQFPNTNRKPLVFFVIS